MKKRIFGKHLEFSEAVATLVGTIIGAGVLAIPYAFAKAGFLTGLLNICVLSFAVVLLYLFLGEIVLRTKGKFQLTGYAEKYLGKWGKGLMAFTMIFGIYGALVAYLIGEGRSLAVLFGLQDTVLFSFWGFGLGGELLMSLLFFFVASMIVYFGLNVVKISELFMSVFIGIIILALCAVGFFSVDFGALGAFDFSRVLIPYGVVLFALAGAVAIPEMKEQLRDKKLLKKAIIIGALIPIVLYVLFSLVVVGVCENVSEVATICLGDYIGFAFVFGNLFAVLAMFTSFLTLGLGLRWAYNFDYKISKVVSCVLATLVPLVIFLLILFFGMEESFFRTIGLTGGVAMTIEGILIVLMFGRAKKMGDRKPEYSLDRSSLVSMLLVLVFLFGFAYTILSSFGVL